MAVPTAVVEVVRAAVRAAAVTLGLLTRTGITRDENGIV